LNFAACVKIIGRWRHVDKTHSGGAHSEESVFHVVHDGAAGGNLRIFPRHAAERDEEPAFPGEHIPARVAEQQFEQWSNNMRHQYEGGADAIVIFGAHEPTDHIEEAVYLAQRVMETASTCPAIGAAENRLIAEIGLHAAKFVRHQVECFIPRYFDKWFGTAPLWKGAGTALDPAFAHRGTTHAQARHLVG